MDTYLISDIADELNQNKTKVRRTIKKLGLKEVNNADRLYTNSPKEYSSSDMDLIRIYLTPDSKRTIAEHDALQSFQERNRDAMTHTEAPSEAIKDTDSKEAYHIRLDALQERNTNLMERSTLQEATIKRLEDQLEQAHKDKTDLIRLLDQQQHLNLTAQDKLETLQIELRETEADSKGLFSKLFRSKKD